MSYGGTGYGLLAYGSGLRGEAGQNLELHVSIGSKYETGAYEPGSLSISASLASRWVSAFRLKDFNKTSTVKVGQEVLIRHGAKTIFGGTVDRLSYLLPGNEDWRIISVQCVGFDQLADRKVVSGAFLDQPAGDIVKSLAEKIAVDGVTTDAVQAGPNIGGSIKFQSTKLSSALDRLADLVGYTWFIDHAKRLNFVERTSFRAPYGITPTSRPYFELSYERTRRDYRNVQFVRAGKDLAASRTRKFEGNGTQTTFDVEAAIGAKPTVKVDAATKTVGIRGVDDDNDAAGFDWFWSKGERSISQNRTATPLSSTPEILEVIFQPLFSILLSVLDVAAISDRRDIEGGSGRYEAAASDAEIEDASLATSFGQVFLRKHARINTIVSVRGDKTGIAPGQLQSISIPSESVADDFLIESVSIQEIGNDILNISYKAIDNEQTGGWQEFFKRLIDFGRQASLGGPDEVQDIAQALENVVIADDASGTASGDSLGAKTLDKHTLLQVGNVWIGKRYTDPDTGAVTNVGPQVGRYKYA